MWSKTNNFDKNWRAHFFYTAAQIILFTTLITSFYAVTHFFLSHQKIQSAQRIELEEAGRLLHHQMKNVQQIIDHLTFYIENTPEVSHQTLRKFLLSLRFSTLIQMPTLSLLAWVSNNEKSDFITQIPQLVPNKLKQKSVSWLRCSRFKSLVFQKKFQKPKGQLVMGIPLTSLVPHSHILVEMKKSLVGGSGEISIPLPYESSVLILRSLDRSVFSKDYFLAIFWFGFFAFLTAISSILGGRHLYCLAKKSFKVNLCNAFQEIQNLHACLEEKNQAIDHLQKQQKILIQAVPKREAIIEEVIHRNKLNCEKVYLVLMSFFEKGEGVEGETSFIPWIQELRDPYGTAVLSCFPFRSVFENVMAFFVQEVHQNQIQLTIDDHIHNDMIETDRLILSLILLNIFNACMMRLPQNGQMHVTLRRHENHFSIAIGDDGYVLKKKDFLSSASRQHFFFLEDEVLTHLCVRSKITIMTQNKGGQETLNHTLIEVPITLSFKIPETPLSKETFPPHVILFSSYKENRQDFANP